MNTSVVSIQAVEGTDDFIVGMSIGDEMDKFTFTVEKPKLDPFVVIVSDLKFAKYFRFNQHISADVTNLVGKVYYGKPVDLPADVGKFFTPEEAIAQQKPFQKPPDNVAPVNHLAVFEEFKERIEEGLKNNMPRDAKLIILGQILYAVTRDELTNQEGSQLEEMLGGREQWKESLAYAIFGEKLEKESVRS